MSEVEIYLNLPRIQTALGFKEPVKYEAVNMDLNEKWSSQTDISVPSTREIALLLDSKHTPVLFINGNNDVVW